MHRRAASRSYVYVSNLYYGVPLTSLRCDDDGGDDDDDDLPVHL